MTKIAIIGAGISGLGAAALLHRNHDITVFEKSDRVGGHARTLDVDYDGKKISVDTGFIVYNERNYPHLAALFRYLGVPTQESSMTFGVTANDGAVEWGAENLNALFGQRRNLARPQFLKMLADILRFNATAEKNAHKNPDMTLGELLAHMRMGSGFLDYYILPMGGAIWSCGLDDMLGFPAADFVAFFKSHGLLTVTQQPQWRTVTGGSRLYVEKLSASFRDRIRLSCDIRIFREGGVRIVSNGKPESFDHVVFACSAPDALMALGDPGEDEKRILSVLKTKKNVAVLHRDVSLMPRRRRCWSSWVYHAPHDAPQGVISVTYWMNNLQNIDIRFPIFVTLNPRRQIAEKDVFDRHEFFHPVYTRESMAALGELKKAQGKNRTWFCGAWMKNGFHEDGLSSAVDVAAALGVSPPWL